MRPGRRPGHRDTRAEILAAARRCFAAHGYDNTSIRGIAREAGVDPSLVHHYFEGKPALFVEVIHAVRDPGEPLEMAGCPSTPGAHAVLGFLSVWERLDEDEPERFDPSSPPTNRFCTAMQAVTAAPDIADALREFLADRVWARIPNRPGEDDAIWKLRRALVASELVGMGFQRYVMRLEPVASATPLQLARWFGPAVTAAATGPLSVDGCPHAQNEE
jgi:AcrR family transcriptional regulator